MGPDPGKSKNIPKLNNFEKKRNATVMIVHVECAKCTLKILTSLT